MTSFPAVFWQTEPVLGVFFDMIQSGHFTGFLGMAGLSGGGIGAQFGVILEGDYYRL